MIMSIGLQARGKRKRIKEVLMTILEDEPGCFLKFTPLHKEFISVEYFDN